MSWRDYKTIKKGIYDNVGFHEGRYCYEVLTDIFDLPAYFPITKEEFDTFDEWKNDTNKIVKDIQNRPHLYSAYSLKQEMKPKRIWKKFIDMFTI